MKNVVSYEEARNLTKEVLVKAANGLQPVIKLSVDNVIFGGDYVDFPLVKTALEGRTIANGCRPVLKIVDGQILFNERPFVHVWTNERYLSMPNRGNLLGFHSLEGAQTYAKIIRVMKEPEERNMLTQLLLDFDHDLYVLRTKAEARMAVRVTKELVEAFPAVPESYHILAASRLEKDVELTAIEPGDALVLEGGDSFGKGSFFYVIKGKEFEVTYSN